MPSSPSLDELGIRLVTHKNSLQHDYLSKYERLFAPMRRKPITILEIGVAQGASLNLWEQYFPRATIVGIDIEKKCKKYEGGRKRVEIASQDDAETLAALGRKYEPSIIIDDGSHRADHILTSFEALFPSLRAGGLYIVEDLSVHFGAKGERIRDDQTLPQYLSRLALGVCSKGNGTGADRSMTSDLEGVEFFHSAAVLRKKPLPRRNRIGARQRLVREIDSPRLWGWFSGYLTRNGDSKASIAAARRAIELAPNHAEHHRQLVVALEHAGKVEAALATAQDAADRWPHLPIFPAAESRLNAKKAGNAGKQMRRPIPATDGART